MSAGGAVEEPLPSIWILTFGYILRNVSAHSAIMLFMVSEPTLLMLPETPEVFWYAGMPGLDLHLLRGRDRGQGQSRRRHGETLHELSSPRLPPSG